MGNVGKESVRDPAPTAPIATAVPEKRSWRVASPLRLLGAIGSWAPGPVGRIALQLFLRPRRKAFAATDEAILRAATSAPVVPFKSAQHNATALQCYVWGNGSRTVLLAHGWESHAGRLSAFVLPLVAAGFRVVAFDAPAHGRSNGSTTDMIDYAAALGTIIEKLGPIHAVIAHSFGGAATLWFLAATPNTGIQRLVLCGTPSSVRFMVKVFSDLISLPERAREAMSAEISRRYGRSIDGFDLPRLISSVQIPTLIVHDRQDNLVPFAEGEALNAALPDAILYPTDGLWHSGTIKNDAVIARAIAFISETSENRPVLAQAT